MLRQLTTKTFFLSAYILACSVQLYAAFNHQLFGDEAFYWLEGQWPDWSYSEVPGWTPWTHTLMDWLFPQHHFFIRIPNLIAAFSIPWIGVFISRTLAGKQSNNWIAGLLLLALPILGVAGTLAVPDIWIVFFTLLAIWTLILAIKTKRNHFFIALGLILALGINVHLRFWLVILATCTIVFWQFRNHKKILLQLLKLTLPMMLIGFIPVLLFNLQHDFPLLSFQLKDRHPWEFQTSHFNFFLVQIIITTPWVFYLCLKNIKPIMSVNTGQTTQPLLIRSIVLTAVVHWLIYAILGFFSDSLRLNVHWTLISYTLLLVITGLNTSVSQRLKRWAIITGITANLWLLLTLSYWLLEKTPQSPINIRITNHAKGWEQLAAHTDELLARENNKSLLTDHFMTLAQLQFYAKNIKNIKAIPHPQNIKHGRSKQLEIMGLLESKNNESKILLVEHSALKLTEMIPFYQSSCILLNGIELISSLDVLHGLKRYHYFKTNTDGNCQIPPIIYYEVNSNDNFQVLSGWILHDLQNPIKISLYNTTEQSTLNLKFKLNNENLGANPLFADLNPTQYQLLKFKLDDHITNNNDIFQLKLSLPNQTIYSQQLILNN